MIVLTLALVLGQAAAAATADVTRELTQFEQQLANSYKKGDCAAWGEMLAPDWSVVHITGDVVTKAQALQMCKAPAASIETFAIDDIAVRQYGDSAVVTGRTRIVTGGAAPATVTLRFTDLFIRRGGRWQVVGSHATQLPRDASQPARAEQLLGTWAGTWEGAGSGGGFELILERAKEGPITGQVSVTGEPSYKATLAALSFDGKQMSARYDFPADAGAEVILAAAFDGNAGTGTWSLREKSTGNEVVSGNWKVTRK